MKTNFALTLTLALVQVTGILSAQPTLADQIAAYIKPYAETRNFNGTVLVAERDRIIFEGSYGFANEDFQAPNQSNTIYHMASVSKNFTAAAVLILEQKGLLNTSDLVSKHIPDYPSGARITLHHLLTHTSGIPNINDMPEYAFASRNPQTPESLVDIFKNKPLEFDPGAKYKYSNSNYNLLALVIEEVSGLPYGAFLQEEIFRPAGMKETAHHGQANKIIPQMAVGYQSDNKFNLEKSDFLDWSSKTGNGSLYTTAHDLLAWNKALADNSILSSTSLRKMYTDHEANSGYGCFVKPHLKRNRYYMNGRSPGFTSYFARYPDDGVCIIVLANNYIPVATSMGMAIAAIVLREKYEPLNLSTQSVEPNTAAKLLGSYQFDGDFYRPQFSMKVTEKGGQLMCDWGELIPIGDLNFIARAFWSSVSFESDNQGNVRYMIYDGYRGKRTD